MAARWMTRRPWGLNLEAVFSHSGWSVPLLSCLQNETLPDVPRGQQQDTGWVMSHTLSHKYTQLCLRNYGWHGNDAHRQHSAAAVMPIFFFPANYFTRREREKQIAVLNCLRPSVFRPAGSSGYRPGKVLVRIVVRPAVISGFLRDSGHKINKMENVRI